MKNNFYQMKVNDEKDEAELYIYGDITSYAWYDDDVCAYDMAQELQALNGKKLTVRINSLGGDVSQGLAIYNLLKTYKGEVTTLCDGFACSAASVIFMAGSKRRMPKSSLLLIHNAWTWVQGDANALRKEAADLEKLTQPSIEIYKTVSNLSEEQIKEMMDAETWITAEEAFAYGFATSIVEDEAQQSVRDDMIAKLVLKNKALEKEKTTTKQEEPAESSWFFS